ncbi:MAG TPA: AAA family ATPase [Solirubrobacteraceae bacterium]|nr:AAA family ATPase [Solirubrobacteraceae bacterium]
MTLTAEEPLLEREAELSALRARISDAERGSGGIVLVEGEAGIGKTRLLAAAGDLARERGLTVLSARGGELERDFAFGIVRQLLEPLLRTADVDEREQLMAGAARFCEPVFSGPAGDVQHAGDPSYAILHGLYWLLANVAERAPVMLAVDDAHWADRPSLRFIGFLARRLEATGILIALASRRGEPGAEADLLRSLWQELGGRPIEPGLLSEQAVARLVRSRLGTTRADELAPACHEATRGNPFLLSELLVELSDRTAGCADSRVVSELAPRGVAAAILGRLGRLPEAVGALARSVAILGEQAQLSHAAALAGLEREEADRAAECLAHATILQGGRPLRFVHPVVRSAIHENMPAAERSDAHRRAARLLAAEGIEADAITLQLLATEPAGDPWVVETLREAARGALARGAPEVATRYLRRALAEPPEARAQVLLELGSAETRTDEPGARVHLAAARELADEPWVEVSATIQLAQVLAFEGSMADATSIALRTRERFRDRPNLTAVLDIVLLVFAQCDLAARQMTEDILQQASDVIGRIGQSAPRHMLAVIALEHAVAAGRAHEAAALAESAVADGRLAEGLTPDAPHPVLAGFALALADRAELAERGMTEALAEALRQGSMRGVRLASAGRAWTRYRRGALVGAEADARAFLEVASDSDEWDFVGPVAVAALVAVLVERGELPAAAATFDEWDVRPQARESLHAQVLRESRARLHMAEGRPRDALRELAACARWERAWGANNGVWVQWRSAAAIAHAELGDTAQARHLADEELRLTRRFGAARAIGVSLSAGGLVHGQREGVGLLREAVELLEHSDAQLEHARALVRLGALLRRLGHRTDSRQPLRSGLDLAARIGASALAETARQELLAAGGRPRRPVLTGKDALTPSERRVVELAAAGQSNREIAQSLYLTVRTIEMHLSNAYHKLGIRSRDGLAAKLAAD